MTDQRATRDPRSDPPATPRRVPPAHVDFNRRLVCLLGLPFDVIDLGDAVERIRGDAFAARRCFVSTPNLNFAMTARRDPVFRRSVWRSDLCLVDGMPLVWLARVLGLSLRQRVSGADVFEALQAHPGPPLNVFLFGGPPQAAARARERINQRGGGVQCVGFDEAGFGTIESMSSNEQIERINRSGAHFVVVSLGAKKGQAWIEHNLPYLFAPVLCHLGAVVNFAAGSVQRAPRWMRWSGLEWLWRIKEEPALWRRYADDARRAVAVLATRVLPDVLIGRVRSAGPPQVVLVESPKGTRLKLSGAWADDTLVTLRGALSRAALLNRPLTVDLSGASAFSNGAVAVLLVAHGWFDARAGIRIVGAKRAMRASFRRKLAEVALSGLD